MENRDLTPVVLLAGTAVAGVLGYQYLYLPWAQRKAQEEAIRQEMLRRAQEAQRSGRSPFDQLSVAACQGVALYYGIPPQATSGICKALAPAAAKAAIAGGIGTVKGTIKGVKSVGSDIAKAGSDLVKSIGNVFKF